MKITDMSDNSLIEQLIEECGELVQVCAKRLRILRGESPTPETESVNMAKLIEEMADVELCLSAVEVKYKCQNDVDEVYSQKFKRWNDRLNGDIDV